MEWDARKKAQEYLRLANALHPEDHKDTPEYEVVLARQDFFYECYMQSFSLEKFKTFLSESAEGKVRVPEDVDEASYSKSFVAEACRLLKATNA